MNISKHASKMQGRNNAALRKTRKSSLARRGSEDVRLEEFKLLVEEANRILFDPQGQAWERGSLKLLDDLRKSESELR